MIEFDVGNGLLDDGQVFQSQEVHLDQAGVLDDTTLVLGHYDALAVTVGSGAHGHPVCDIITTDDHAAGMYTSAAHAAFQFLGKADGLPHSRVFIV